ncbi:hypothetical protein V5O48_003635 [Marasmius crinis-equi]|uniref:Uncharacterized protein n=1 Tax=Marasmius crinis-equi TaxID=585013 RepID=A0ABR3FSB5_9AGAR
MTNYPDTPYAAHLQPDCDGGRDCADNAGCALHPFTLLLNVASGSLVLMDMQQAATYALGAKFCPEVVLHVQCPQGEKHTIEFQTNWEEGGEDLIMKWTDLLEVPCECPETLYAWDWKAANCIVSGVRAYMAYRRLEVEEAERMDEGGYSWSDVGDSSEDESTNECADNTSTNSESSDDEPPRKRRTLGDATAIVNPTASAPPAGTATTAPAVPANSVHKYFELLDDGSLRRLA